MSRCQRPVYGVRRSLPPRQRDALLTVWSSLIFSALQARDNRRTPLARSYADDARALIGAFGMRWDGKSMRGYRSMLTRERAS